MSKKSIKIFEELPCYISDTAVLSDVCNCGPGLADDIQPISDENSFLYVISGTNEREFDSYIASFETECAYSNENEAGKYYTYKINGNIYYIYYLFSENTVRIIQDRSSTVAAQDICVAGESEEISVYQYSLNYEAASVEYSEPKCIDCGMLYIIRLPDGSLILIDSGHGNQATESSQAGLYGFMKKISKTAEGEKVRIRAWFFTHAHGDHCGMAATFLGESYDTSRTDFPEISYADMVTVENIIFNFPSRFVAAGTYAPLETSAMRAAMRRNFPQANYIKLHTGQFIDIFGLHIEALYTWEDSVKPDGSWGLKEFNSTSTVIRFEYGTHSLILLADTAAASEAIMLRNYTEKTLHSEIVQVAHHCINKLSIYSVINAGYALVPSSYNLMSGRNVVQYSQFRDICTKGIFCADACTWELMLTKDNLYVKKHARYDAEFSSVRPVMQNVTV